MSRLNPDHFWDFIIEREMIRKAKERGEPRPWTQDPVLHNYHFPNIRRIDDPTTVWLHSRLLPLSGPEQLKRIIAFRMFCTVEAGEALERGFITGDLSKEIAQLPNKAINRRLPLGILPSSPVEALAVVQEALGSDEIPVRVLGASQEEMVQALTAIRGIGEQIAYEMAWDLSYQKLDWGPDWVPVTGPVCAALNMLYDKELTHTRHDDRQEARRLMAELVQASSWTLAEIQRALALFPRWAGPAKPTRRYRWKSSRGATRSS